MIDDVSKTKLLQELEKTGNVSIACLKTNISRATFYRWHTEDEDFKAVADAAIQQGRGNAVDIVKHALFLKAKDGEPWAVKYFLSHNAEEYRPSTETKVVIEHRSISDKAASNEPNTLTDYIKQSLIRRKAQEEAEKLQNEDPPII